MLLESVDQDVAVDRPTCVGGRGDAPVEDWPYEEPPPPHPFDLAALDEVLEKRWTEP